MTRPMLLHKHNDATFGAVKTLPKVTFEASCNYLFRRKVVDGAELCELSDHEIVG